jgi:putative transposase
MTKNEKIKQTLKETRTRRKALVLKTYVTKIDSSHFNKKTKDYFNRIFLEAKWLYNSILSNDIRDFDTKTKQVTVLNKDKEEEIRDIKYLSSQMKQSIMTRIIENCIGLKNSKKNGRKIGRLRFKTQVNSIPLKQYNNTFKIVSKNKIQLQNCKQKLRVNELKQLKNLIEIASAKIVKKSSGLYFHVTGYENSKEFAPKGTIGIDFGIKTSLAFSNGIKVDLKIPVDKQIKRAHKLVSRSEKNSKNRMKKRALLQRAYEKRNNKKKDAVNKITSYLKNNFEVSIQNEMIKQWQSGRFGKSVANSSLGEIKGALKNSPHTLIVHKSFPSTKLCPNCGCLNSISIN